MRKLTHGVIAGIIALTLHGHAAAAEPTATPPVGDTGPIRWDDPAPVRHAPSVFGRHYPAETQRARDWAWRKLGAREWACLDQLWHFESGWRVSAGVPSRSFGIPQAYPGAKMRSAGADWQTNPMTQVRWGLGYIHGRYGTPCKAWSVWQVQRWY